MAGSIYLSAKGLILNSTFTWATDDVQVALVNPAYSYSASHSTTGDLGANIVATSGNLSEFEKGSAAYDTTRWAYTYNSSITLSSVTGTFDRALFTNDANLLWIIDMGVEKTVAGEDVVVSFGNYLIQV